MEKTMIKHPKLRVCLSTGCEGPRHDPYMYEEMSVETPAGKTVLHVGLGVKLTHNGYAIDAPSSLTWDEGEKWLINDAFPRLVGHSQQQIIRIASRLESRCKRCGGRSLHSEPGYPGEYFDVCDDCGHINGCQFNRSEIE